MKKYFILILVLFLTLVVLGQTNIETKKATITLSDPTKPSLVEVSLFSGTINVEGYSGKEILVEGTPQGNVVKSTNKQEKGMYVIENNNIGLEIEEKDNNVEISSSSFGRRSISIKLKVPINTSLNLRTLNNGTVTVKNVNGDLEVSNLNGPILMTHVSGTVVAHSLNGAIKVLFDKVSSKKPMSFITMTGDVDVTFPSNINFNVKLDNKRGNIYSDFKITINPNQHKQEEDKRKEGGKYKISFNQGMFGKINQGGPELTFKTMNGDIFIRAKK